MRFIASIAAFLVLTLSTATATEWCSFLDKEHAQVRCGYSSLDECKQALTDKKDGYCMPDPGFASLRRANVKVAARAAERASAVRIDEDVAVHVAHVQPR